MPSFSERLVELRKAQSLTQKQLAEAIGANERGIRFYEAGEVPILFYHDVSKSLIFRRFYSIAYDCFSSFFMIVDEFRQQFVNSINFSVCHRAAVVNVSSAYSWPASSLDPDFRQALAPGSP